MSPRGDIVNYDSFVFSRADFILAGIADGRVAVFDTDELLVRKYRRKTVFPRPDIILPPITCILYKGTVLWVLRIALLIATPMYDGETFSPSRSPTGDENLSRRRSALVQPRRRSRRLVLRIERRRAKMDDDYGGVRKRRHQFLKNIINPNNNKSFSRPPVRRRELVTHLCTSGDGLLWTSTRRSSRLRRWDRRVLGGGALTGVVDCETALRRHAVARRRVPGGRQLDSSMCWVTAMIVVGETALWVGTGGGYLIAFCPNRLATLVVMKKGVKPIRCLARMENGTWGN